MPETIKTRIKTLLALLLITTAANNAISQISEKGTPPSFRYDSDGDMQTRAAAELVPYTINSPFTAAQLIEEDENAPSGTPYRIGILLAAGLEFPRDAEKSTLPGGEEIYRLRIKSDGATALSLYYDHFEIPEGGKLYIYNADHTHLLGAYTRATNPDGKAFSSQFVAGDDITLEYAVPQSGALPQIKISDIGYGYNHLEIRSSNTVDISCMVNINCPEGDNWQDEKEGIIKMATRSGSSIYSCSASLLNNTGTTPIPYIYTAFHCIKTDTRQFTEDELRQAQFTFQYENTDCTSNEIKEYTTLVGCQYLTGSDLSGGYDQTLLLLTSDIPGDLNPYFCGWDKTGNTPQYGVGIHHPNGSTKKISTYTRPATQNTWVTTNETGATNGHWVVYFAATRTGHSVTASGSSGSPLFNESHKVVGALTGGSSTCSYPNGSNYYGKISKFFPQITQYLDPDNTGSRSTEGRYYRSPKPVPQNLAVQYDPATKGAQLTWETAQEEETPVAYTIYRNGYEIGSSQTTAYTEASLYPGLHEYTVAAVYDDGSISTKSNSATLKVHITAPPAAITVKRVGEQDIQIDWSEPLPQQPIYWGKGSIDLKYKISSLPHYIGQHWNPSDLEEVNQYTINQIEYFSLAGAEYELYIKNGDNTYSEQVPVTAVDKTITRQIPPFTINAADNLICGLKITGGNNYHIASDSYEAPVGRETIFSTDGITWAPSSSFTHNLYIKAHITPPTDTPEEATPADDSSTAKRASSRPVGAAAPTYKITRNGTEIATTGNSEHSYTDTGLEQGTEYTYTITADYGYEGTAAATSAPFLLKTESFDADIHTLTVNGTTITPDENGIYIAPLLCGTTNAEINITAHPQATITINGESSNTMTIDTQIGGRYDIDITITSQSGENSSTSKLLLYKLPDNIIYKRWNDVLVVINNPDNNGGLQFTYYKWYINGQKADCTEQYIYLPEGINATDRYSVELTTTDGITLTSCEQTFPTESDDIRLYPTIVSNEAEINLYIKSGSTTNGKSATLYISDMSGRITTRKVTGEYNKIKAPNTEGSYIIKVVTSDGKQAEFKIRVKK